MRHLALAGDGRGRRHARRCAVGARRAAPPEAQALLEVVCIAGAPISLEVAAQACRLDASGARAVASLRVATLVREIQRGRKPDARAVSRPRARVGRRRHRKRAPRGSSTRASRSRSRPRGEPRDPQLLLRNFLLAELPQRAARYAEEAAQRSEAAHAFDQAAELWRTALDMMPRDADDRRRVLLRLGEALVHAAAVPRRPTCYLGRGGGRRSRDPPRVPAPRRRAAHDQRPHRARARATLEALLAEIGVASPKTPRGCVRVAALAPRPRARARPRVSRALIAARSPTPRCSCSTCSRSPRTSLAMIDVDPRHGLPDPPPAHGAAASATASTSRVRCCSSRCSTRRARTAARAKAADRALEIGADRRIRTSAA